MDAIVTTFQLIILLFSVVIHEVSHGAVALALGDTTARDSGRLTLNPIKHLDLFGSVILPITLLLLGGFVFGWAKPVPYNPYVFRNRRWGGAVVGLAGPFANIALASIFAVGLRILEAQELFGLAGGSVAAFFISIVIVNLFLAVFNLMPVPPLDGSKLLFAFISDRYMGLKFFLERYGLFLLFLLIFFIFRIGPVVFPVTFLACKVLTGFDCLAGPGI